MKLFSKKLKPKNIKNLKKIDLYIFIYIQHVQIFKNLVKNIFIGEDNDKDILLDKIINLNISNNVNISIESPKPEKMAIEKDLFDKNYYYKYLFIDNDEYKFNSLKKKQLIKIILFIKKI